MGKSYADDLRLVVVRLIEEGHHPRPEVAELCGISVSSVGRYIRRYQMRADDHLYLGADIGA